MANSVRWNEPNPALKLATLAGKIELSFPFGTIHCVPQETFSESHVINPLLTKLGQDSWILVSFVFACLWTSSPSRFKYTQKNTFVNFHLVLGQ